MITPVAKNKAMGNAAAIGVGTRCHGSVTQIAKVVSATRVTRAPRPERRASAFGGEAMGVLMPAMLADIGIARTSARRRPMSFLCANLHNAP